MPRNFLAVDYGEARIGLAAAEDGVFFPYPVETVPAQPREAALERIVAVFLSKKSTDLVMGLPIREDGTEGSAAEKIRHFTAKLARKLPTGTPVFFQDEYRSTSQAKEALRAAGKKEKNTRKYIDQVAAVVILEDFLRAKGLG